MSDQIALPPEVVQAIQQNRKIEAIKLLRESRGIGLKEAKQQVDSYIGDHPHLAAAQKTSSGLGCIAVIVFIGLVAYLAYRQFG